MAKKISLRSIKFIQNIDQTILVMRDAARWLKDSGKNPSEYWQLQVFNREYLLNHAEPDEFFVGLVEGIPAVACLLQDNQRNQSWKYIDGDKQISALYIHWLSVDRRFAGMDLPKAMVNFARQQAKRRNIPFLRLDTEAKKSKLRNIYKKLGFSLMGIDESQHTAFYQKPV